MSGPNQELLLQALRARYERAMHAVQTGVSVDMERGSRDTQPKHLRVGVNSAMVTDCALTKLLIARGVFTELEYYEAVAMAAEDEQRSYEQRLGVRLG